MSHTVITTSSTTTTVTSSPVYFNVGYTRTYQGMLHVAEVVTLLIAFLCVNLDVGWTRNSDIQFFEVVTLWFHIAFLVFLIVHFFALQNKLPCINWLYTEFLHCVLGCILVLIASIVLAVARYNHSAFTAGLVFGFISAVLLLISLLSSYQMFCGRQAPR